MKTINAFSLVVLCLIRCSIVSGQDLSMPVSNTITSASNNIYLHTDRSYYLPGESMLFKAYILDDQNKITSQVIDTLHVSLIDQEGLRVASGYFPLDNNMIKGSIELPEFLSEGNYMLIAYGHLMTNLSPERMFSRVIGIRKSVEFNLVTELSLTDTLYQPGSPLTAQIKFSEGGNKPVSVAFTYQLTGSSGEIRSGKSKADNEGRATITIQLPEFNNNDTLKLLLVPANKSSRSITGIVIPTRYNYNVVKKLTENDPSNPEFRHLNILIKPDRLRYAAGDKVQLDISVTDDKGTPVMTNLSLSASNLLTGQMSDKNDNLLSYSKLKNKQSDAGTNQDIGKYFAWLLLQKTQSPGNSFIVQEKNNIKKIRKEKSINLKKTSGYSGDRNIFDIIMQIRPYHINNGKISFGLTAMNSINNLDGALIIVDGIKMGTDASILNSIPVPDIARIAVSTNVMDIQRYSALNSVGIIEIFMKKTKEFTDNEDTANNMKSNTLFWAPDIITDITGKATMTFFNNNRSDEILITVNGRAANGVYGSSSLALTVER